MRKILPLVTALVLGLAACGDGPTAEEGASSDAGTAPRAMTALAIPDGAQLHLELTTQVTIEEYDVHDEGPGDTARISEPVTSEWWLMPDGTFIEHRDEQGLRIETVVEGGRAWRRVGAVVADIPAAELPSLLASAEDVVCLLGWAETWPTLVPQSAADADDRVVFGGDGRPARHAILDDDSGRSSRLESYATGGPAPINSNDALAVLVVERTRSVEGAADAQVPAALRRTVPGPGRTTTTQITIDAATIAVGETLLLPLRPEAAAPVLGDPVRRRRLAANVVISEHAGPLTDVPRLDLYIRRGLDAAKASATGALGLEIDRFPGEERPAAFRMVVPVSLSRDRDAQDLSAGMMTRVDTEQDVVAVPYRGALPASAEMLEPVLSAVRALGLEPDGPIRLLLPTDVVSVDPSALAFEIEVPVRERD